jgi:FixJ family two-component response regulator
VLRETTIVSIVDDDESVRDSVSALVRSLGYTPHAYPSAEDFLNSAAVEFADCLVADIQMPGMNGIELQQALLRKGSKLPIIFITAFPEDHIKQKVLGAGALYLLRKPCDGDVLVSCIESALTVRKG